MSWLETLGKVSWRSWLEGLGKLEELAGIARKG